MKSLTKSRIEVIVCYTILFYLFYVFYSYSRNRLLFAFPIPMIAFIISFMASFVLYFIHLSVSMQKENIKFKELNQLIKEQGYCPECIRLLDELLASTKSPIKRNNILMQMVGIYLCLGENQKIAETLKQIDISVYMALPKATSTRCLLAEYYRTHFHAFYELGDYDQAEEAYQKGKPYFNTYDKDDLNVVVTNALYEAMHQNFHKSFQYIESIPIEDNDDLKFLVESAKADIYQMMKEYDKAEQGYQALLYKCKFPYQRALIERELGKVNTSKSFTKT